MATRKEQRLAAEEAAATAALERALEFKLTLPSLLLHLMARASKFADFRVRSNELDWNVEFRFFNRPMDNARVGPDTEEWEYEQLVNTVEGCETDARLEAERLALARETYDNLSEAQREALGLKRRP